MKCEILFRGKRTDNGEWVYGAFSPDVLEIEGYGKHIGGEKLFLDGFIRRYNKETHHMETIEVAPDTIGQFTGMTDKNGKRIFEGDIVCSKMKYGESKGIIVFRNGRFSVDWRVRSKWSGNGISCRTDDLSPSDEVLGTMFDNPELLEVKS